MEPAFPGLLGKLLNDCSMEASLLKLCLNLFSVYIFYYFDIKLLLKLCLNLLLKYTLYYMCNLDSYYETGMYYN